LKASRAHLHAAVRKRLARDADYFAGFRINEMNPFTVAAHHCLEVAVGAFGRVVLTLA